MGAYSRKGNILTPLRGKGSWASRIKGKDIVIPLPHEDDGATADQAREYWRKKTATADGGSAAPGDCYHEVRDGRHVYYDALPAIDLEFTPGPPPFATTDHINVPGLPIVNLAIGDRIRPMAFLGTSGDRFALAALREHGHAGLVLADRERVTPHEAGPAEKSYRASLTS
jgi:hypothetical protein